MNIVKKELTPELKEKLNRFKAVKPKVEIIRYTPEIFKEVAEEKDWPVFELQPLSSVQEIDGNYTDIDQESKEIRFSSGKFTLHYFRKGLKKWFDPAGLFGIDFKPEYIANGSLTDYACSLFPVDLIREISNKLIESKAISDDEKLSL